MFQLLTATPMAGMISSPIKNRARSFILSLSCLSRSGCTSFMKISHLPKLGTLPNKLGALPILSPFIFWVIRHERPQFVVPERKWCSESVKLPCAAVSTVAADRILMLFMTRTRIYENVNSESAYDESHLCFTFFCSDFHAVVYTT
jgi:hypothetical protein